MKKMVNDISKYQQEQMKYKRIRKRVDPPNANKKRTSIASVSDDGGTANDSCAFCNTSPVPTPRGETR